MERRETTFAFHTERTRGQISFEPVMDNASYSIVPKHEERRDNKMLWSIVSNAAEVKKTDAIFLRAYGIDEVVIDIQNRPSRLSRVVLTVCRLSEDLRDYYFVDRYSVRRDFTMRCSYCFWYYGKV